jgi:hypothetical protein
MKVLIIKCTSKENNCSVQNFEKYISLVVTLSSLLCDSSNFLERLFRSSLRNFMYFFRLRLCEIFSGNFLGSASTKPPRYILGCVYVKFSRNLHWCVPAEFHRDSSDRSQPNFSEIFRLCLVDFYFFRIFLQCALAKFLGMGLGECSLKYSVTSQWNSPRFSRVYFLGFSQNFIPCISSNCIQIFFATCLGEFSLKFSDLIQRIFTKFSLTREGVIFRIFNRFPLANFFFWKFLERVSVNIHGISM